MLKEVFKDGTLRHIMVCSHVDQNCLRIRHNGTDVVITDEQDNTCLMSESAFQALLEQGEEHGLVTRMPSNAAFDYTVHGSEGGQVLASQAELDALVEEGQAALDDYIRKAKALNLHS